MRNHSASPLVAMALVCLSTAAQADTITLTDALVRAARRPSVAMATEDTSATRAEATGARLPTYNPELSVAAGPRLGGGETLLDLEVQLTQTVELGGKRAARTEAAEARVRAATAELDLQALLARQETWRAFEAAAIARTRLQAARDTEQLAADVAAATAQTQALGSGTRLEVNLSGAEMGRARHDRVSAENRYEATLADLATAVGAPAGERLEPDGVAPTFPALPWTEDELVALALRRRPELTAAQAQIDAARADVRLADARAKPDLGVGLSYGFEQDPVASSHVILAGVSIALPLRNRNQGERRATRSRARRAQLDQDRQRVDIERDTRLAYAAYARAREALLGFDREVTGNLRENLELARESFASGKIDYFKFSEARRDLIANELAYLDALDDASAARQAVLRASGQELP